MTYPYGMYGAPRVGNGLGGLPRRTVAVAAATTDLPDGTIFVQDSASKVTLYSTTSASIQNAAFGDPNAVSSLTKVTQTRYLVPYYTMNTSGTYVTLLKSIEVTASGIAVSSNTHTIGDNNTRNFRCNPGGGFMSGDNYIQPFCPNDTAASINVVTLSRSQITASFTPPASGTIASGTFAGNSYASAANVSNYMFNSTGSFPAIIDNGDGTGTLIRRATMSGSQPVLMAFVYDASLTLLDTHVLANLNVVGTTTTSVAFAYYEDISNNRRIICSIIAGSTGSGAVVITTFNRTAKSFTSLNRTYSTASYTQLGSIFVQTSRSTLAVSVTGIGGETTSFRATALLDSNRAPTTVGTSGNLRDEFSSNIKFPAVGLPFIQTNGSVISIGALATSYSQTMQAIDPFGTYSNDPSGVNQIALPLITKFIEYPATSAAGYRNIAVTPYVSASYINRNESNTVTGDYGVDLAGKESRINDRAFLGITYDNNNSTSFKELGFVIFRPQ